MAEVEVILKPAEYVLKISQEQLDKLAALTGRVIGGGVNQPIYDKLQKHVKVEYDLVDGNYPDSQEIPVIYFKEKE